jgi:hypothetical protein
MPTSIVPREGWPLVRDASLNAMNVRLQARAAFGSISRKTGVIGLSRD